MQLFPMIKWYWTVFSKYISLHHLRYMYKLGWFFFIYHFENIHSCFSYQANIYLRPDYARHFTKLINKVNYTQMHKSSLGQSYICHKWSLILRKNNTNKFGKNNIETKCKITLNVPCKLCILLLIMISTTTTYDTLYVHTQSVHSKIVGFLGVYEKKNTVGSFWHTSYSCLNNIQHDVLKMTTFTNCFIPHIALWT